MPWWTRCHTWASGTSTCPSHRSGCGRPSPVVKSFSSAGRLGPDAAVLQKLDLRLDHLLPVLRMLHRLAFEIKVLGIDRLLVKELVKLCAQVLEPVVQLGAGEVVEKCLDVDK